MTIEERFWAKVDVRGGDECWEWQGAKFRKGYGCFAPMRRHPTGAHRFSWRLATGVDPGALCVLHHCDNPSCVNPAHLFVGDRGANARDMLAKGRHWVQAGTYSPVRGEQHPSARLSAAQVAEIRERYASGERQGMLGREYGVSRTAVGAIVRREVWA